jgi:hypothetical protein
MEESREVRKVSDKIEQFWRDADGADVMRVMDGQTVEARFRAKLLETWLESLLAGWTATAPKWYCMGGARSFYDECQVYDPPEWYINKPEPGIGYRLLEKFPPEELRQGDEYWSRRENKWLPSPVAATGSHIQLNESWYRRRIANNPETPNSCRSRDIIPSGWRLLGKDEDRLASDAYWSQGCNEWLLIGDDRVEYANDKTGKWHAIRRMEDFVLVEGFMYTLPSGKVIRITAKGFEVE